jgi:hypothetical protein
VEGADQRRGHRSIDGALRVPLLKGIASLLEAEGFIAASVRALMTRLSHGGGMAPKVYHTPEETAAWARELLGDPGLTAVELVEVIRRVREG